MSDPYDTHDDPHDDELDAAAEGDSAAPPPAPVVDDRYTRKAARDARDKAARGLTDRLISARHEWFIQVPLDDEPELAEALELARRLKRGGAKARQVRFVGRLLRDIDPMPLVEALDRAEAGHRLDTGVLHAAEGWRDRFLAEGVAAVEAFVAEHPEVDRQRLRQLVRQAAKDAAQGKPPKARRAIFRLIRPLLETE